MFKVMAGGLLSQRRSRAVIADLLCVAVYRYDRDAVQQLAEAARRAVDMSDNAARPR